jgi:hypothetical protein
VVRKEVSMDNHYLTIFKSVYDHLQTRTASLGMVHTSKGFDQREIRNIVRELERKGLAMKVEKRRCKTAGALAWYYTTNPKLFPVLGEPPKSNTIAGVCQPKKRRAV